MTDLSSQADASLPERTQDSTRSHTSELSSRGEALLSAIRFVTQQLLETNRWQEKLPTVLERLGTATQIQRVCVHANLSLPDRGLCSQPLFEWAESDLLRRGASATADCLTYEDSGLARWVEILERGEPIHGNIEEFPLLEQETLTAQDIQSILVEPIFVNQTWWGRIACEQATDFRFWSSLEIDTLKTVAFLLGQAIQRQQTEDEVQHQLEEIQLMQKISLAGYQATDENELIRQVTQIVTTHRYTENFGVLLIDEEQGVLRYHPTYLGVGLDELKMEIPLGRNITGRVALSGQPVIVADTTRDTSYSGNLLKYQSEICVPIQQEERILGVLNAESSQQNAFNDSDLNLLMTIAAQLGTAMHMLRLFDMERQRRQEAEILRQVTYALTSSLDVDHLLQRILVQLEQVVPYDSSSVILLKQEGLKVAAGRSHHGRFPTTTPPGMANLGHIREIVKSGMPVILRDTKLDPGWMRIEGFDYVRCWMGVPLKVKNEVIGILNLDHHFPGYYDRHSARLATSFANQAAIALENARLYQELEDAYVQTIISLARAVDARDSYTANHSQRLIEYTRELCARLGISQEQIQNILYAALLHDIGKIGVPDEILRKPGPLNEAEWTVMKKHPVIGAEIISPVTKLSDVVPLVRAHQERYDGSGYPDGLTGESIPIGARILAVVDAYTAITDQRVYRPARSHLEALDELRRYSGRHFDPGVVEVFLNVVN